MVNPPQEVPVVSPMVRYRFNYYELCRTLTPFHWLNLETGQVLPGLFPENPANPNCYLVPNIRGVLAYNYCEFIPEAQNYNWGVLHGHIEAAYQDWDIILG